MMWYRSIIVLILLGYSQGFVAQNLLPKEQLALEELEEVFDYSIYLKTGLLYFSLGELRLTKEKKDSLLELHLESLTYKKWKRFYELETLFTSQVDTTSGFPERFVLKSIVENIPYVDSIEINQALLLVDGFISKNDTMLQNYKVALTEPSHDLVSMFYALRHLRYDTLQPGAVQPFNLVIDREEYKISALYRGLEEKKIKKGGKHLAYRVDVQTVQGDHFAENHVVSIWFAANDSRTPLSLESPLKLGSIRVVLSGE